MRQQQLWEEILHLLQEGKQPSEAQWNSLTPEEQELLQGLQQDKLGTEALNLLEVIDEDNTWNRLKTTIEANPGKIRNLSWGRPWIRYAAAVAGLLIISGLLYLWIGNKSAPQIAQRSVITPANHKRATLILENGKAIDLKQNPNTTIAQTGNAQVRNEDTSTLYYTAHAAVKTGPVAYNKLVVPRGGEYKLVLADGSEVWVNAESSLRFPVHFDGTPKREVYLESGEAYFKVAKNAAQPFIVHTGNMAVQVLGTSFNVNTYGPDKYTTLVEGHVRLSGPGAKTIDLLPNQQGTLTAASNSLSLKAVDVEPYVAWKDGLMIFEETSLEEVATILGRWYDVNFVFTSPALRSRHFGGKLRKYQHIEEILAVIERTHAVSFDIKDRTIYVKNNK